MSHPDGILIIDFGSQFTQLIARRVREQRVYCEIHPPSRDVAWIRRWKPKGVILSGGPNSVYGEGWYRESGILTHNPSGTFCHSFVPQKPFPGYPSSEMRPAAPGDQYRFTISGPGVTPIIQVTVPGVERWRGAPEQVAAAGSAQRLWNATMLDDKKCANENGNDAT